MRYYFKFNMGYSLVLLVVIFSLNTSFSQEKKISIQMDSLVRELIQFKITQDKILFAEFYYTIQIGFGSHQEMNELREEFETYFPNEAHIIFETPNYKLHVGKSRNQVQLHKLLREIKGRYPDAFILENT